MGFVEFVILEVGFVEFVVLEVVGLVRFEGFEVELSFLMRVF
ncbi:hypothetical protein HanXRQr2_Chr09g0391831 [Helianthus annuus]|uniref:Uncharacterized protein n=1 Tax=Helianthus annuus TaxID=4232 RepID=A0A9K3I6K6_HELAN|nr:hypothetical protein HanXRQr2_Chr09g0391831 [Helianthus annuus]KAJ0893454.1 hypothetical protein HanPSC8_Chr09g0377801 [Helianthus annuus]